MLNFLKQSWWKYLSLVLLMYSTIAGLYIPLAAGVSAIAPLSSTTGNKVTLHISGYNTHFAQGADIKVYLKSDSGALCATNVIAEGPQQLSAEVDLPANLKVNDKEDFYNLIVNDPTDGTFFLRNAFTVKPGTDTTASRKADCVAAVSNIKSAGRTFPNRVILYETIRNLYFHVPMWFSMITLLMFCFGSCIAYLATGKQIYDTYAEQAAIVALLFGTLGLLTGMTWANYTWGKPWVNDPRLNGAAVGMLVYIAYIVLRGSLDNRISRAKVSAVYGIFAFVIYVVFIFVVPRMNDSLHPGTGGNPAFSSYDLDNTMRMVFYPACIGFIGVAFWIMSLRIRMALAQEQLHADEPTDYQITHK